MKPVDGNSGHSVYLELLKALRGTGKQSGIGQPVPPVSMQHAAALEPGAAIHEAMLDVSALLGEAPRRAPPPPVVAEAGAISFVVPSASRALKSHIILHADGERLTIDGRTHSVKDYWAKDTFASHRSRGPRAERSSR